MAQKKIHFEMSDILIIVHFVHNASYLNNLFPSILLPKIN